MMNDKEMEVLDEMEETLIYLREQYRTVENLYNTMRKGMLLIVAVLLPGILDSIKGRRKLASQQAKTH